MACAFDRPRSKHENDNEDEDSEDSRALTTDTGY